MRRAMMAAVVATLAAGCGDPADSMLEPGTRAVVVAGEKGAPFDMTAGDRSKSIFGSGFCLVPSGSEVTVASDPGPGERGEEGEIAVTVVTGEMADCSGMIYRGVLRPIR